MRMTLRELRSKAVQRMESDVIRLEKDLANMKSTHGRLQQSLFDTVKNLQDAPDSARLLRETEDLKRDISELVVSMHHLDARISRLRHRARRLGSTG
jgi:regulator of replication initiation timing